jgi:hypothetical protein
VVVIGTGGSVNLQCKCNVKSYKSLHIVGQTLRVPLFPFPHISRFSVSECMNFMRPNNKPLLPTHVIFLVLFCPSLNRAKEIIAAGMFTLLKITNDVIGN